MSGTADDHASTLRDHGYHQLRVKQVVEETHDAGSLVLDVPDDLRQSFRYRPGQFCTFRVPLGGDEQFRSYSMSSAPETDPDLTVTVKRVPGGLVSNWILDNLSAGSVVEATRPGGVFCPQDTDRPVMAFCGGSGIAPVMSIIKHVLSSTRRSVSLLYANRDQRSVIFGPALADMAGQYHDRLTLQHHVDTDSGFVTPDELGVFASSRLDADCYICGPRPFMDLVEDRLLELGVETDHIFIERFLVEEQERMSGTAVLETAADVPEEVTLILGGKTTVVRYQPGDTILETARRGGLRPPFSCQAGNCATCMAFLKEGSVAMRANNALSEAEVEEGWILTCQALPSGQAVTIEYEAM